MSKDEKSNYYDAGGIEVLEIIKAKLTPEQYKGYLLGNVIKYSCRLNSKNCAERDCEKLANYSAWLKEQMVEMPEEAIPDRDCNGNEVSCDNCAFGDLDIIYEPCCYCDGDYSHYEPKNIDLPQKSK